MRWLMQTELGLTESLSVYGTCRIQIKLAEGAGFGGIWNNGFELSASYAVQRQRAAVVMSLVQCARMHGHDPWAYLKDVLSRLPGHLNSRIDKLLPHRWQLVG